MTAAFGIGMFFYGMAAIFIGAIIAYFIIKRIKHEFDFGAKKHGSILTLAKDSLSEKLDGPDDQYEPKPEKSPTIISEKEIFYPQL